MSTAMQIGETARDRADFCRCFKAGAAVFLHDDGIVAHSTYRNTSRAAYMLAGTNCDTRGRYRSGVHSHRIRIPKGLQTGRPLSAVSSNVFRVPSTVSAALGTPRMTEKDVPVCFLQWQTIVRRGSTAAQYRIFPQRQPPAIF